MNIMPCETFLVNFPRRSLLAFSAPEISGLTDTFDSLTYNVISFIKLSKDFSFFIEARITIYKIAGGQLNRIKILHYAYNRSAEIK